ncbi:unnamed protein product (macronuclear) [Paramecium tetraurelia]|uniref:Katanin p80 subunit C-terminal domain-containing protein n=1 Tax=Paramecium tetraurelia TaxID=5888 RepID=A0CY73_PARTE|nr:uncharacterized protein GSPATT00039078001 [Paramecium tetraurelia]CAK75740.1 unnamed protein product [Paramecium tetraurelia]|eukprot:XP_001443137.1 hypothetical protein (macronuclear) [Paramecium tetraurelia strain d4-2]
MNRNLKLGNNIKFSVGEIENLSKIKLARFSETATRFFTYVDDTNQIYINKIENSKNFLDVKLFNPFHQYFVQSQNEISSIIFSSSENEIINGSSKGIITFVDISTQKIQSNIKGHLSSITALAIFPNQENMVFSGAMDSQVKLWDSRSKTAGFTLRAHTLSISTLAVSPDGKLLASGSNDGSVKIWDIHQQKLMATFNESDSSITCLQFNPLDKAIATASDDGCIRYWDLDKYNQISSTKPDKQTVYSIRFCNEGKSLISAQNFSFKCWDLERDALLLDNVESQCKSILDTYIFEDRELFGLSTQNQTGLSVFGSKLSNINFDSRFSMDRNKQRIHSERIQGTEINDQFQQRNSVNILKPKNSQKIFQNNLNQKASNQNLIEEQGYQICNNNGNKFVPTTQIPQMIAYESVIQEEDVKENQQSVLDLVTSQDEVNLSSFVIDDENKLKFIQIDMINEIQKDHNRVMQILKQRINYMKPIMYWWSNNNIKSAINAINQLVEPSILFDALTMCSQSSRFKSIPIEQMPQMLEKCKVLIDSKYLSHIKGGIVFSYKAFNIYRDKQDIITIKCFNQMSKVDLSREERVAKYDKIVEQLKQIIQMSKLTKLIERNKEEISDLAKKFQIEMLGLLKRINQQQ